jgi:hypothetical protein
MYIQYIQGLFQSRLGTADYALVNLPIFYILLFGVSGLIRFRDGFDIGTASHFIHFGNITMNAPAMIGQAFGEVSMSRTRVFEWSVQTH